MKCVASVMRTVVTTTWTSSACIGVHPLLSALKILFLEPKPGIRFDKRIFHADEEQMDADARRWVRYYVVTATRPWHMMAGKRDGVRYGGNPLSFPD